MTASVMAAYLLGCIPFGLIIARLKGVDLRAAGSGNIGATNALRVMGKKEGAATLIGDMLKGVAAVLLARVIAGPDAGYLAAVAVVLGHDFPVFMGFRGGKGVATSLGAVLALYPLIGFVGIGIWLAAVFVTRVSSLGALVSFAALPICVLLLERGNGALLAVSASLTVLVYVKHRSNITRILRGEESRIGQKAA